MISTTRKRVIRYVPYWDRDFPRDALQWMKMEVTVEVTYGDSWQPLSKVHILHWDTLHRPLDYPRLAGLWALLRSKLSKKRPVARLLK